MKLGTLCQKNDAYDAETWEKYDLLYKGGAAFRKKVHLFLDKNPVEPDDNYQQRLRSACYRSYVNPIVNFFAAQLMASAMTTKTTNAKTGEYQEPDKFYADLKENVDGCGTELVDFMRETVRRLLVKRCQWWLACMPENEGKEPESRAEWSERGLGNVRVTRLEPEAVLDWETDEDGEIIYAVTYCEDRPRPTVNDIRKLVRRTWYVYDTEYCECYQRTYDPDTETAKPEDEIPSLWKRPHGFTRIPLLHLELPEGLWLLDVCADTQLEHFRLNSGLGWAIRRACYAMPVFRGGEPPRAMGSGYMIHIEREDSMEWAAPPSDSFDVVARKVATEKDEIYRVAQQMAQGVDNNAAAVGRSGASKLADANATEVCLKAYGAFARGQIENLFELVSDGRGDTDLRFSVEGLEHFNLADATQQIANAQASEAVGIPSPTHKKELLIQMSETLQPGLDQVKKDLIRQEIEAGVDAAEKQKADMAALARKAATAPAQPAQGEQEGATAPQDEGQAPKPVQAKAKPLNGARAA